MSVLNIFGFKRLTATDLLNDAYVEKNEQDVFQIRSGDYVLYSDAECKGNSLFVCIDTEKNSVKLKSVLKMTEEQTSQYKLVNEQLISEVLNHFNDTNDRPSDSKET